MHLVICYDVVQNKRRAKLHKRLKGFLRPVQRSVFEGELPGHRHEALIRAIVDTIDHETDTVRVYHLCKACAGLTELWGTSVELPDGEEDVVL